MDHPRILNRVDPGKAKKRNETRRVLSVCWFCKQVRGHTQTDFQCCSRCRCACYCSVACQRASWTPVHRRECEKLDRLKTLTKSDRREVLSLQLAVQNANWGSEPRVWMVLCKLAPGGGFQYMVMSPQGYEESIRKTFTTLPTDEHMFKFGGDLGGKTVFVGASGRVMIFKQTTQ